MALALIVKTRSSSLAWKARKVQKDGVNPEFLSLDITKAGVPSLEHLEFPWR